MPEPPPDVVLLDAEWPARALIRAQLIEAGLEVIATNTWAMMRRHLRPGSKPLVAIVDLKGLPDADLVLRELHVLMKPERVLVLGALNTVQAADIECLGFRLLRRPMTVDDVVDAARAVLISA